MTAEAIKHLSINSKPCTLWAGRDAEGRKVYGVTADHHSGMSVQPSSLHHYSQKAAMQIAREDIGRTA